VKTLLVVGTLGIVGCATRGSELGDRVPVSVKVSGPSGWIAGARVAFVDPDGQGTIVVTDENAVARGAVVPGGSVTAEIDLGPGNGHYLSTVFGVQEDDELEIGTTQGQQQPPPVTEPATCTENYLVATYRNIEGSGVEDIHLSRGLEGMVATTIRAEQPLSQTADIAMSVPGAARAFMSSSLRGPWPPMQMPGQQQVRQAVDGCAPTYEVDLGMLLPWIDISTVTDGVFAIPMQGGQLEGDYMKSMISYEIAPGEFVSWNMLSEHTNEIVLPVLPEDMVDLMPPNGAPMTTANTLVEIDGVDGYAEARTNPVNSGGGQTPEPAILERVITSWRITLQ
jgi:hypothetical protein